MNNSVYQYVNENCSFSELLAYPLAHFPFSNIETHKQKDAFSTFVGINSSHLFLVLQSNNKPLLHPDSKTGLWMPELWKYDVVELFIQANKDCYLEINLAPNGAWWHCYFQNHRVIDPQNCTIPAQTFFKTTNNNQYISAIQIDRNAEILKENDNQLKIHCCGIFNRIMYSFSKLPNGKVDFHKKELRTLSLE